MPPSSPALTTFFLPSVPPGPPVVGIIPSNKTPVNLSDFDIPLHLNIRDFRASLKPMRLALADLDYHSVRYWEYLNISGMAETDAPIVGDENWLTYGLLMEDLNLLIMNDLNLLTMHQIESSAGIGTVSSWNYSPGMIVEVPTTGRRFTSTFDHDNLLVPPFDESGTYYIELVLRDFPAKAGNPTIDHEESYISFSSSITNESSVTDVIPIEDTISNIDAGGNVVWRINRDSLENADIENIRRIDLFMKAIGGEVTFKAEALRLVKSTYPYHTVAINTKTGMLTKNPSQRGTNIDSQPDPPPIMNIGTNKGIDFSEILKFNTGHLPAAPNFNNFTLYLRADVGSGEYVEVDVKLNTTETMIQIYEGGTGVRQLTTDPLSEETDHFIEVNLIENQIRVVIWEALGNYPIEVKFNSETDGIITIDRVEPGWVALDFNPYNADFTIDYMFARNASIASLITKSFESITPVKGVSLYSSYSPARQILDVDSVEEGPAVNLLRIPVLDSGANDDTFVVNPNVNDVSVSLDSNFTFEGNASYLVRKQVRNAFLAGVQWDTMVKINDPLNTTIRGAVRFDENLNYGKFRVVLFDKFFENVAFVSILNINDMVIGKWNEFEIPVLNEKIYNNEFRVQFHHIGINENANSNSSTDVGSFWLDGFKIETETVIWEASNDNGLTFMRFFDTIGNQYQGVNFPTPGNQLKLRARAFHTSAWVNGFQAVVQYAQSGRILE